MIPSHHADESNEKRDSSSASERSRQRQRQQQQQDETSTVVDDESSSATPSMEPGIIPRRRADGVQEEDLDVSATQVATGCAANSSTDPAAARHPKVTTTTGGPNAAVVELTASQSAGVGERLIAYASSADHISSSGGEDDILSEHSAVAAEEEGDAAEEGELPASKEEGEGGAPEEDPSSPTTATKSPRRRKRVRARRRRRKKGGGGGGGDAANMQQQQLPAQRPPAKQHDAPMTKRDLYFCLRCGMVRVAVTKTVDAGGSVVGQEVVSIHTEVEVVARVTLVNWDNQIVHDVFVKPEVYETVDDTEATAAPASTKSVVTDILDFRTPQTGVTRKHLESQDRTVPLDEIRRRLKKQIKGKILIGHMLPEHLAALGLRHPWTDMRDTARFAPFMTRVFPPSAVASARPAVDVGSGELKPTDLPTLLRQILNWQFVSGALLGEAIGCLDLYKRVRTDWETELAVIAQQQKVVHRNKSRTLRSQQPMIFGMHLSYSHHHQHVGSPTAGEYVNDARSFVSPSAAASGVMHPSGMPGQANLLYLQRQQQQHLLNPPEFHRTQYPSTYTTPYEGEQAAPTMQTSRSFDTGMYLQQQRSHQTPTSSMSVQAPPFMPMASVGSPQQRQRKLSAQRMPYTEQLIRQQHQELGEARVATQKVGSEPLNIASLPPPSPTRSDGSRHKMQRPLSEPAFGRIAGDAGSRVGSPRVAASLDAETNKGIWLPSSSEGDSMDGDGWSSGEEQTSNTTSAHSVEELARKHLPAHLFDDGPDEVTKTATTDTESSIPQTHAGLSLVQEQTKSTMNASPRFTETESIGMPSRLLEQSTALVPQEQPQMNWSPLLSDSFSFLSMENQRVQQPTGQAAGAGAPPPFDAVVGSAVAPPPGFAAKKPPPSPVASPYSHSKTRTGSLPPKSSSPAGTPSSPRPEGASWLGTRGDFSRREGGDS